MDRSPNTVDGYEKVDRRNIQPTFGTKQVTKVTMKMLTDLYGRQEMGFSITRVAMRAGHDPSIAAKHDSGRVTETDRALATAVASLIAPAPATDQG